MADRNIPLVYVVEPSKILSKFICTELEKKGFGTVCFTDGLSVLRKITEESPDCIIADKMLPVIDGTELCAIIKEGSDKSEIPFILISAEDDVLDFWTSAHGANKVIPLSSGNFQELIEETCRQVECKNVETGTFFTDESAPAAGEVSAEAKPLLWTVKAMDKSTFFFSMVRQVLPLYNFVDDTDVLVRQLFALMYRLCSFDAAAIILDDQPARAYRSGTERLSEDAGNSFWQICRTDYAQLAKKNHGVSYEEKEIPGIVQQELSKNNFESYRSFEVRAGEKFVGTVHLASCRKRLFTYKVQSTLEFLLSPLAYLLQESIRLEKISTAESKLRLAFSKFVPEQVINDILVSQNVQEQEHNEKRRIAILICDIRNFTTISEINQPEDVVNFLNNYFTHMVDIVKRHGGTVDKFIGDAIMVLFGAPISYVDNARRAVSAAIEMYSHLDNIDCSQLKFPEGIRLDIGIGIHYGEVIVGNIGSKDKTNYTVIGDAVNLTSRLEGLTKLYGSRVIISGAVRNELPENMHVMLLDSVKVKGKKKDVQIYRADAKALPKAFTDNYEKGLNLYSSGAWTLALSYFEKALEIMPQDKAAKLMAERCTEFSAHPPEDWDGAVALTSK